MIRLLIPVLLPLFIGAALFAAPSAQFKDAVQARVNGAYIMVVMADGSKSMVPSATLSPEDRDWLLALSKEKPLAGGKSSVVVVAAETAAKTSARKTIEVSKTEGPLETVRLCPPNILRDQIGGTCMLYARIHYLDIAGYYLSTSETYKIINDTPDHAPWLEPRYVAGLTSVFTRHSPKPVRHRLPAHENEFDWARAQLRKGRPLLAAFPREIWQALPPDFVAAHPWNGGPVGHQIVVNGFTWNRETRQGTFHIINSWAELPSFDLTTEAAKGGALVIEESLSPLGEPPEAGERETVRAIRLIKQVGAANLYEVETTRGTRRMVAPDEAAARRMIEEAP